MEAGYYEMRFLNCTYLIRILRSDPPSPWALVTSISFFTMAQQPLVVQGLLIIKGSRSHSDTPHSVGLLWTSDQPDAETSTRQNTQQSQQTDIHTLGGIRTHIPSKRAAADPSLRSRGHWDLVTSIGLYNKYSHFSCRHNYVLIGL